MSRDVIAMIPARKGSQRLRLKNLALLDGRPVISYAIEAAKAAGVFRRIVVNADSQAFADVAREAGVEFHLRPEALGSSTTKADDVADEFMRAHPADSVAWVNPTSPLQTGEEVRAVVQHFLREDLDSLITVALQQVHCVFQDRPINFDASEPFAQTQQLTPVHAFVYSVMVWRTAVFRREFEAKGYAMLAGRLGYYPVSKLSAVLIKTPEDLLIAEALLQARRRQAEIAYDARAGALLEARS